jgi:hypothetical protein
MAHSCFSHSKTGEPVPLSLPFPLAAPLRARLFAKYHCDLWSHAVKNDSFSTTFRAFYPAVFRRFDKSTLFLSTLSSTKHRFFYFFKPKKYGPKPFAPGFFDQSLQERRVYASKAKTELFSKVTNRHYISATFINY